MNYHINASSIAGQDALISVKESEIHFGTRHESAETLPNPVELFLGSLAACMLKNVERFSDILKFSYTKATLNISATRIDNPPRIENIIYDLSIYSTEENLNTELLKKNIEKFGTIFNTVKLSCSIEGTVKNINI